MPAMGNDTALTLPRRRRAPAPTGRTGGPTSLADALFTTTQQRVLALLYGQPSRSFFLAELIGLAGSGSGAVQREVGRLRASGLVTVRRVGKRKQHQANPGCPVFEELRALVRKTVAMAEPIRRALAPLAESVALALLHGPAAKGTDTADSGIDILVVSDDLSLEDLRAALAPAEASLARAVNPALYTRRTFARRRAEKRFLPAGALEDERLVLMGSVDDAARRRRSRARRASAGGGGTGRAAANRRPAGVT